MMWSSTFELDITPSMQYFKSLLQKYNLNMMNKHLLTLTNEEQEKLNQISTIMRETNLPYLEQLLNKRMPNQKYFFGDEFDVLDICLGFCLGGAEFCNLLNNFPHCKEYCTIVNSRQGNLKSLQQMMNMIESLSNSNNSMESKKKEEEE
ncbi:predicted protein [Naegleria gruberi]|uniref:Predicted protein n=1 Tax=Naegleria gruberi TaxID=5762 RepID=D2VL81_NAEGR|nr:uncharacterized protein NAEGRDRAFT_69686 [Naegleria gruberi]EFC42339.1 predicted protein [Naegleria gruberi]|eukprot:XP_002675083.1 predicted protein [Naegleria gruberi strain NEG-M]